MGYLLEVAGRGAATSLADWVARRRPPVRRASLMSSRRIAWHAATENRRRAISTSSAMAYPIGDADRRRRRGLPPRRGAGRGAPVSPEAFPDLALPVDEILG
jgi:hypothetical protein